jgi:PAS domain S-box-containing protein
MARNRSNTEVWDSLTLDLVSIQVGGKIVFINKAGAEMLGAATPEQLVGRSILDFVHPDYQEIAIEQICQMIHGHAVIFPITEQWIRLDGRSIDVEVAAMPLVYQGRPAMQFIARHDSASGSRKPMRTRNTAVRRHGKHPR